MTVPAVLSMESSITITSVESEVEAERSSRPARSIAARRLASGVVALTSPPETRERMPPTVLLFSLLRLSAVCAVEPSFCMPKLVGVPSTVTTSSDPPDSMDSVRTSSVPAGRLEEAGTLARTPDPMTSTAFVRPELDASVEPASLSPHPDRLHMSSTAKRTARTLWVVALRVIMSSFARYQRATNVAGLSCCDWANAAIDTGSGLSPPYSTGRVISRACAMTSSTLMPLKTGVGSSGMSTLGAWSLEKSVETRELPLLQGRTNRRCPVKSSEI